MPAKRPAFTPQPYGPATPGTLRFGAPTSLTRTTAPRCAGRKDQAQAPRRPKARHHSCPSAGAAGTLWKQAAGRETRAKPSPGRRPVVSRRSGREHRMHPAGPCSAWPILGPLRAPFATCGRLPQPPSLRGAKRPGPGTAPAEGPAPLMPQCRRSGHPVGAGRRSRNEGKALAGAQTYRVVQKWQGTPNASSWPLQRLADPGAALRPFRDLRPAPTTAPAARGEKTWPRRRAGRRLGSTLPRCWRSRTLCGSRPCAGTLDRAKRPQTRHLDLDWQVPAFSATHKACRNHCPIW